jgi:hypothetical protein
MPEGPEESEEEDEEESIDGEEKEVVIAHLVAGRVRSSRSSTVCRNSDETICGSPSTRPSTLSSQRTRLSHSPFLAQSRFLFCCSSMSADN